MDFSIWQIAIVLVIALIVFGPKRLPELGSSLGRGMREFKDSISGKSDDEEPTQRAKLEPSAVAPRSDPGAGEPVDGEVVESRI